MLSCLTLFLGPDRTPLSLRNSGVSTLQWKAAQEWENQGGDEFTPTGSLAFGAGAKGETHKRLQNKRQESPGKNTECAQRARSFHKCCSNLRRMEFSRQYPGGNMGGRMFHFSHSVVSDSLRPHGLQHTRPPCPSPTPGVHPNPCPLSR